MSRCPALAEDLAGGTAGAASIVDSASTLPLSSSAPASAALLSADSASPPDSAPAAAPDSALSALGAACRLVCDGSAAASLLSVCAAPDSAVPVGPPLMSRLSRLPP